MMNSQSHQAQQAATAAQVAAQHRELKVEDALLYLDQVKSVFGDRPQIYNKFLEIMKNFKAQSINTPGVIDRVRKLFKGYNDLILGFNAFLPEGEGYRIDLTPEEIASEREMNARNGYQSSNLNMSQLSDLGLANIRQQYGHMGSFNNHLLNNPMASHLSQMTSHIVNPNMVNLGLVGVPPHLASSNYSQSNITNSQQNLLSSPNTQPSSVSSSSNSQINQTVPKVNQLSNITSVQPPQPLPSAPVSTGNNQNQQLHAISYVTRIRNRFSDEPDTYKLFLKILHTYQKEQKGIKEVLEQVSHLFADHPDLLKEFTYFLPDAVQDQAKERLERAAKESEARKLSKAQLEKGKLGKKASTNAFAISTGLNQGQPGFDVQNMLGQDGFDAKKGDKKTRMKKKDKEKDHTVDFSDQSNPAYARLSANVVLNNRHLSNYQLGDVPMVKSELSSSTSAEAHFFSTVKEILLGISKHSWIEFIKCLDMYTNEAISREEMLLLISDILGPNHRDIIVEFQRLIENKAVYMEEKENIWFGVPLSEIDFSQCRKCTPSYRALPKDYPRFKSSHFNEAEVKELNNSWVSIPIGSEESYSFKHMRKNQYEEALFKFEDEKFELDMLIDSNTSTIRALEPLCEEILKSKSTQNTKNSMTPRFSLQLEERMLSTIHLNSISRLYGDHGDEILELLKKNPVATIPIVLKRLQQKEKELKKTRQDFNKSWKEVVEKNHYKSFDHRSFYFRQQDKKYISSKSLFTEITSHSGDKRPVFDDSSLSGVGFLIDSELTYLLGNMKPSMALVYENDTHLIHRDIYKIICHIINSSSTHSLEKEKLAILCRDLFRVFFNIPLHYMYEQSPPTNSTAKIPGYKIPLLNKPILPANLNYWPIGTTALTIYGSGKIISYREEEKMYGIQLSFGKVFLTESNILGITQNNLTDLSENISDKTTESSDIVSHPCKLFYGTQICYIFFRLHHILYVRLRTAFHLCQEADINSANDNSLNSMIRGSIDENDHLNTKTAKHPSSLYSQFLKQVYGLVEGSIDQVKFEDYCRTNLGNKSYVLYTLDRLLSQFMKQLHIMANDDNVQKLTALFDYHINKDEIVDATQYKKDLSVVLNHSLQEDHMYRIQFLSPSKTSSFNYKTEVAIEQFPVSFGDDGDDKKKEGKKRKSLGNMGAEYSIDKDEKKRKKKKKKDELNDVIIEDEEDDDEGEKLKKKKKMDDRKENLELSQDKKDEMDVETLSPVDFVPNHNEVLTNNENSKLIQENMETN